MNVQMINIPLDHGRKHIHLAFKQEEQNGDWVCIATDESMQDIVVLMKEEFGVEE